MKKILFCVLSLALIFSFSVVSSPVFAGDCSGGISDETCNKSCSEITDPALKAAAGCDETADSSVAGHVLNIINFAISVVGIIAILVIVMGGQRYVTSGGDPGKTKQAKDMILYAIVAIIVAGLAFAIVAFASNAIKSSANTGSTSTSSLQPTDNSPLALLN